MCIGGTSQFPLTCFRGIDQWGERFGYLLLDPMVGAIGAFSFRDGIATGGQVRSPICRIGNVEHNEQSFPIAHPVPASENTDSGGAGKYRGGNSAITAFIPHGTSEIEQRHGVVRRGHPDGAGPGGRLSRLHERLRVQARQRHSRLVPRAADCPATSRSSAERDELLQLRQTDIHQGPSDVYAVAFAAGAGYGDPIERDPERGA